MMRAKKIQSQLLNKTGAPASMSSLASRLTPWRRRPLTFVSLLLSIFVVSLRIGESAAFRPTGASARDVAPPPPPPPPPSRGIDKIVDRIFDKADSNHDGSVSIDEVYPMILKLYVWINRQAHVPPPTRAKTEELITVVDVDRNGRVSRDEFGKLMAIVYSRAATRLVAHKFTTFVVAPLLALQCFRWLTKHNEGIAKFGEAVIPEKSRSFLLSSDLWQAVLTIVFVKTLGNIVLAIANALLDRMQLRDRESEDSVL